MFLWKMNSDWTKKKCTQIKTIILYKRKGQWIRLNELRSNFVESTIECRYFILCHFKNSKQKGVYKIYEWNWLILKMKKLTHDQQPIWPKKLYHGFTSKFKRWKEKKLSIHKSNTSKIKSFKTNSLLHSTMTINLSTIAIIIFQKRNVIHPKKCNWSKLSTMHPTLSRCALIHQLQLFPRPLNR